jgi:glycosyltransferase involved in cell wall biosynthesis
MISAVVLTKNEERNIEVCLESLYWANELVVVDDYSTDETGIRIKNLESRIKNIKVYKRRLEGDFATQRNFGLSKAEGDWILFVDADERISPVLQNEIIEHTTNNKEQKNNGYFLRRRDYFLGKWLRYGETANVRLLRLAKKRSGEWARKVHETWNVKYPTGELKNPILHYPHPTISGFLESINFHSDLHSLVLFEEGKRTNVFEIIFFPLGKFGLNYIWRLGFLDGIQGLIMALVMSLHSFLARAKLYAKTK